MKKYNANSGWFRESQRHSLSAKGIPTGRKSARLDYAMQLKRPQTQVSYEPVSPEEVTYSQTGFDTPPSDEEVMSDADSVFASSEFESEDDGGLFGIPDAREEEKIELTPSGEVNNELESLEKERTPIMGGSWLDNTKEAITNAIKGSVQSYKDLNVSGIEEHIGTLEVEKENLNDRVSILGDLKKRILSSENKRAIGINEQLKQVKRINELVKEPMLSLKKIDNTIDALSRRKQMIEENKLQRKKLSMEREHYKATHPQSSQERRDNSLFSAFPTFHEILNPQEIEKKRSK